MKGYPVVEQLLIRNVDAQAVWTRVTEDFAVEGAVTRVVVDDEVVWTSDGW